MHQLNVLMFQGSPSHQIPLHQALNAQGVFNVRIADDLAQAKAGLLANRVDLLLLDHAMPTLCGRALLTFMHGAHRSRAVLFVGEPRAGSPDLAAEARRQGAWVLAQLPWPVPANALHTALRHLGRPGDARRRVDIQTVTSSAHAR